MRCASNPDSLALPGAFFEDWMRGWQRRLVIAKALTAIHDELRDSARRTQIAHARSWGTHGNWSLSSKTTKADLERALLAIDLFPRGNFAFTRL
jgi:hypothetical protein